VVKFTDQQVHLIRTSGFTDACFARIWRKTVNRVRAARIGATYKNHPTPPDVRPRDPAGRYQGIQAKPAKVRHAYF
jgi:hypothetical protein